MFVCVGGAKAVNHYLVYNNGVASANGWDKQAVLTLNANLVAGTEYILKAKIKVSASTEEAVQAVPIFSTSENKDTWGNSADVQYLAGYNPTTEFKEYVWYFTAAYTHDKIQFFMGKIGGDVYFDDVTLKENGGSTEFVDNGDFEQIGISNWGTNWGGPSYGQSTDAANADFVLIYNNGVASANGWDKQAVLTLNANLVAGTEYILKAKIKVSASTEEAVQAVPIFSTSENKDTWGNSADVQYLAGYNPTTEFKEYVWYFTAAYTHDKIQFFMGKIGGDVYFDDVTLRENGGSTEFVDNGNMSDANISNWGKNWGGPSFTRWDYEENITVGVDRFMTFSNIKNLSVDGIVSAYGAKYSAGKVVLTPITAIPANKAVIIEADAGPYALPAINSAASIDDVNDLLVSDGSITGDGSTIYALGKKDAKVGFIKVKSGVKIPAGKAYLVITSGGARDFLGFDDDTTGIESVEQSTKVDNQYFNLAGQRVAQPTKGLYIVNGKKVIIK